MKLKTRNVTSQRAWELSKWCNNTAEELRELAEESEQAADELWSDLVVPEEITSAPRMSEDPLAFADRLQEECYEWAGVAGDRHSENRILEVTVRVDRFESVIETEGPVMRDGTYRPLPAISLRFEFNQELIDLIKKTLTDARNASSDRGRPLSKMPGAYGWSKATRCWWVESTYWPILRQALLDKNVKLTGSLAHPPEEETFVFRHETKWDAKRCEWC